MKRKTYLVELECADNTEFLYPPDAVIVAIESKLEPLFIFLTRGTIPKMTVAEVDYTVPPLPFSKTKCAACAEQNSTLKPPLKKHDY